MKTLRDLRIVFFGTPHFAVASLQALLSAGASVVAVVTAPDKPSGRGLQLSQPPVKELALAHNIPVLQPPNLKEASFLEVLRGYAANVQVVVAFRMLPEAVWAMPAMGTINVHASLLPQYRGAAPINWAIINGETETGVTTFRLKHEIDTGNLLLQETVAIQPEDDAGILHDKLMAAGAGLLVRTLNGLAENSIKEQAQVDATATLHAPKIFKSDTIINWSQPTIQISNFIRGLSPHPAAFTSLKNKSLKIFQSEVILESHRQEPGTPDSDGKSYLRIATADGWIYLKQLQQEGKKRMEIAEFLRGFRL